MKLGLAALKMRRVVVCKWHDGYTGDPVHGHHDRANRSSDPENAIARWVTVGPSLSAVNQRSSAACRQESEPDNPDQTRLQDAIAWGGLVHRLTPPKPPGLADRTEHKPGHNVRIVIGMQIESDRLIRLTSKIFVSIRVSDRNSHGSCSYPMRADDFTGFRKGPDRAL